LNLNLTLNLRMADVQKKREPKFSEEELEILLTGAEENRAVLQQKEISSRANASKTRVYAALAAKMTAVNGGHVRSTDHVRTKWVNQIVFRPSLYGNRLPVFVYCFSERFDAVGKRTSH
jgi:hypothetical protein